MAPIRRVPEENLHKEFHRDPGRGVKEGGLGAQILYVGVGFPSRIQCIKNFEGGGLRGSWGWGLRSNFGAPCLYVYVLFWGSVSGSKKVEKSRKTVEEVEKVVFNSVSTLFRPLFQHFSTPGPRGPGEPFFFNFLGGRMATSIRHLHDAAHVFL